MTQTGYLRPCPLVYCPILPPSHKEGVWEGRDLKKETVIGVGVLIQRETVVGEGVKVKRYPKSGLPPVLKDLEPRGVIGNEQGD